jgi:LacI family transcriptional regulator
LALTKKKRPTLKTIAYMTGLGVTTVSKALKDAPDIKDSTKQRVRLIAEQIGYQPDRAGLRLRTGKTNVINLILSAESEVSGMNSELILGVMRGLQKTQYNLVLSPYAVDMDPMEAVYNIVDTRAADGVILSRIEVNDRRLAYLAKAGMPFVTHGRRSMGLDHAYVDFDSEQFARHAVQLLATAQCRRVAIISAPLALSCGQYLRQGFEAGLKETGLREYSTYPLTLYDPVEVIAESTFLAMQQKPDRPDAFVCCSVGSAIGVIGGVEKAGLKIGKDVHIVAKQPPGSMLKWFGRPVHVIEDDFKAAGFAIANSLVKVIEGAPVSEHQAVVYPEQWGKIVID